MSYLLRQSTRLLRLFCISLFLLTPAAYASPGGNVSHLNVRVSELEEQIRQLTGKLEELEFRNRQLEQRLDDRVSRISRDVDNKLSLLLEEPSLEPANNSAIATTRKPSPPTAPITSTNAMPSDNSSGAEAYYNQAFELLRKKDYPKAGTAFQHFIQTYPNHALIENAYYWLGEVAYVQSDFKNATAYFFKGYERFPKGEKAPGNLLKLGISLSKLQKNAEACAMFNRLSQEFPDASNTIKDRASQERNHLQCSPIG